MGAVRGILEFILIKVPAEALKLKAGDRYAEFHK
jgi:hypothetical protein